MLMKECTRKGWRSWGESTFRRVKVALREDEQEKRNRELDKFGTTLKPNMDQYPEKLGRLFER